MSGIPRTTASIAKIQKIVAIVKKKITKIAFSIAFSKVVIRTSISIIAKNRPPKLVGFSKMCYQHIFLNTKIVFLVSFAVDELEGTNR